MNNIYNNKSTALLFKQALDKKLMSDISKQHKDSLRYVYNHFMVYLGEEGRKTPIKKNKNSSNRGISTTIQFICYALHEQKARFKRTF